MYYIGAPDGLAAIYVKPQSGAASMYYAHTDHLGKPPLTPPKEGDSGQCHWYCFVPKLFSESSAQSFLLRGNGKGALNGRMYDPVLGRFLSTDNYVQAADFSQSFNRYSYCWNNPLKFTDPSGELIGEIITIAAMAYFSGVQSNFMHAAANGGNPFNPGDWNWKSPWTYISMASAGLGAYHQIGGLNGFSAVTSPVLPVCPVF